MSQYPSQNQPPSYQEVFGEHNQMGAATIGEVTTTQPAMKNYPILPSAPQQDYPQYPNPQSYGAIDEVIVTQPSSDNIITVGACPICRIGLLEDDYSCLGICLAICFFPLGILCCLACKEKRCTNCHTTF